MAVSINMGSHTLLTKKLFIALVYMDHQESGNGQRPALTHHVAKQCQVGKDFVAKVENELNLNGHVLRPGEIFANCSMPRGPVLGRELL